jgi:hypothetical protein
VRGGQVWGKWERVSPTAAHTLYLLLLMLFPCMVVIRLVIFYFFWKNEKSFNFFREKFFAIKEKRRAEPAARTWKNWYHISQKIDYAKKLKIGEIKNARLIYKFGIFYNLMRWVNFTMTRMPGCGEMVQKGCFSLLLLLKRGFNFCCQNFVQM